MAQYKDPTEREMLFLALGALNVTKDDALNSIHDMLREYLYPEPPPVTYLQEGTPFNKELHGEIV